MFFSEKRSLKGSGHMSFLPVMQKGSLDAARLDQHGKITKQTVVLDGVSVTRVTFGVGAKWSEDLKEYAGTESCQLPHVAVVLSGTLHVVMDDGSAEEFSTGDVMLLPPGHDAWTVGHEPCVFVEFSRGNDYYTPHTHGVH
jgi:ethanolamine utilization protein EutQ (cupin superfamily)